MISLQKQPFAKPREPMRRDFPTSASGDSAHGAWPLVVDARMLFHSGIGRYLREVLSRWTDEGTKGETYIVNSKAQTDWVRNRLPHAKIIQSKAGIYSLGEQLLPLRFPAKSVYWVPHYNLPWHCRSPLVATVHDAAPLVLKEAFPSRVQRLAARFYFGIARRSTRRIVAVSQFTATELSQHAHVPEQLIEVVPNGVDNFWRLGESRARKAFQLLFVGNLKAHKNLGRLLDAMEIVRARNAWDLSLDIIGQTSGFRAGLEARVAERIESSPWIRVRGMIDDSHLRDLYAEATALVFPSLYEGFGLPMLEAMAAGCPVISSHAGSLREIGGPDQSQGGGVIYFDPRVPNEMAGRIEHFLKLPSSEHTRMSVYGKNRSTKYTWETTSRKTRDVLFNVARQLQGDAR